MKTLDEVIQEVAKRRDLDNDIYHYLKKLKRIEAKIEKIAIGNVEDTLSKMDNPPLTWDELRLMEGKPVWVEALLYKQWAVIGYVGENYIRFEGVNLYAPESRTYMGAEDGWQAYMKERKATGGNLTPEPKSKKIGDDTEIKWSENE